MDLSLIINSIEKFKHDNGQLANSSNYPVSCKEIIGALESFSACVRYLNTRRSKGAKLQINSEADVQDAIFLMLRPLVSDITWESPDEKAANRFIIKDFAIPSASCVIEAKYVRDNEHGKNISKELHDDIEMYRRGKYENIIFFVYDPNSLIPDIVSLKEQICCERRYGSKTITCYLLIP